MAEHQGRLAETENHEQRAYCSCGWHGPAFYGRGTAAREHDKHLRNVERERESEGDFAYREHQA